ncbi:hypothetical protein A8W25_05890 [Streptomyces sp. ERV7]|uniref:DUF6879 family protein n=1 Tax=Streptomyces sp. ERV7 TaxID=1322334 RepID=UPI0007F4A6C5|nr:DUF6879 family protein [Streptomyces sp. ERV7]OAR25183.1 hypothetical protein A8W25_05890 [Streptomyces sp. ERV7]
MAGSPNTPEPVKPSTPRRPPILLRPLVAVLVAGACYLLTGLTEQPPVWKLTVSVLAGGAALIIQFMNDLADRIASLEETLATENSEMKELVADGFARVNEDTELFSMVDRSALSREEVTRLVRSATTLGTAAPSIMEPFVRAELLRLTSLMEHLNLEVVHREGEDHDWITTLTECAALTIDATSSWADRDFWASELGVRYLGAQRDAIHRGVRIRRLFIVAEAEDTTPELSRLCDDQRSLGIEVRVLSLSELPPTARMTAIGDFVVFDESLSYEIVFDLLGVTAHTAINLRFPQVAQRVQQFSTLWEAAEGTDRS